MSYALRLADEAKRGLAILPFDVQEDALDRLDELTDETAITTRPLRPSRREVFDFDSFHGGTRYSVFFTVEFDHRTQTVQIITSGHFVHV